MIPTVAFCGSRGRIGTTSLVYHLAWMYADQGYRVLAVDLDPQCHLTAAMVGAERFEELREEVYADEPDATIYGSIAPLMAGTGDVSLPYREPLAERLELVIGDPAISWFEDELALQWVRYLDEPERALGVLTAFHRTIQGAAHLARADVVLVDLGPNLDAINRTALVACRHVVVPVGLDLFSLQGLRVLGPTLRKWQEGWRERVARSSVTSVSLPETSMQLAGYVVMQHSVRLDRPAQAYELFNDRIPDAFATAVMGGSSALAVSGDDAHCLGAVKRYGSLMPMAQEARKPIFHLRPADGALGAHATAAREARLDFQKLADRIAQATWNPLGPETK